MTLSRLPDNAPERTRCPICSLKTGHPLFCETADTRGGKYRFLACRGCGFAFLHPAPSPEALRRFYDSAYYGAAEAKFIGPVERFENHIRAKRAKWVVSRLGPGRSILDVGCGNGGFLSILANRYACRCTGIEPAGASLERARRIKGITVIEGGAESLSGLHETFDAVTLWHVLEHLRDPLGILESIRTLLNREGRLFVSTPNLRSLQARLFCGRWLHLDPPRHLFLADRASLKKNLAGIGFSFIGERRLETDQSLAGTAFSLLNFIAPKDFFFDRIKGGAEAPSRFGRIWPLLAVSATLPAALVLHVLETALGNPATLSMEFRKD